MVQSALPSSPLFPDSTIQVLAEPYLGMLGQRVHDIDID